MSEKDVFPERTTMTFASLCSSNELLMNVEGQFFVYDEMSMMVAVKLTFEIAVVLLSAMNDDTMNVEFGGVFTNLDQHEVRPLTSLSPWKNAMSRPLAWAWRMTNQQGYFDGLQLDFAESTEVEASRIQLLVVASEIKSR